MEVQLVTRDEMEAARAVLKLWESQYEDRKAIALKNQAAKEDACPDHEYQDASYKWGSPTRMECIHCGKIIND